MCQMVCPWNRFSTQDVDASFSPRPGLASPDLVLDLNLSPQSFRQKFKGSAVKRAKRRGYLRNIAVGLGNTLNADAIPALEKAANDLEPLVRDHAAWALNNIKNNKND
jgi:epoxyqueuosine reductase